MKTACYCLYIEPDKTLVLKKDISQRSLQWRDRKQVMISLDLPLCLPQGSAMMYMEPERKVMSRSGDECVVALCDQW